MPGVREHGVRGRGVRGRVLYGWRPRRYDFTGLVFAVVFLCWSLTPSLVPRGWFLQGLVSGILTAIGYGLGVAASHLVRRFLRREPAPQAKAVAWRLLAATGPLAAVAFLRLGVTWQRQIHALMGMDEPPRVSALGTAAVTLLLATGLVAAARSLRWLAQRVALRLHRWVAPGVASLVAGLLVALLVVGILDGIVRRAFFNAADGLSRAIDTAISEELAPPTSGARSGGPGSLGSWELLGSKGRAFVAEGPTPAELEAFSGEPAVEPIRIYVGLGEGDDDRERAALAVAELGRSGAFERAILCVIVPTGTGWINPVAADALEYLHNGDTALVATQYSYLPSWLSYLVDSERAREAGRELVNAVYERWVRLPEDARPLLLVYGESLGSHGAQAAFSGLADLRNRVDGALWVGPPNFSRLWQEFKNQRDPQSPERLPVLDRGRTVRFAATADDLARPGAEWPPPRVVYLQHASDPVVWWSSNLLFRQPDWLREPRGPDVLPGVRWFPIVTFLQLAVDMFHANTVPDGHGHRYGDTVVDAWAAITGHSSPDVARLKHALRD